MQRIRHDREAARLGAEQAALPHQRRQQRLGLAAQRRRRVKDRPFLGAAQQLFVHCARLAVIGDGDQ